VAPKEPGLGFEINEPRIDSLTVRKVVIDEGFSNTRSQS
jgi:hypothetical protein